jgi:hypothetical protein
MDGNALVDPWNRNHAVHRTSVLLDRIRHFASSPKPRVSLVLTRRDGRDDSPAEAIGRLAAEAERLSLSFKVFEIASFSERSEIKPGHGLNDLLEHTLRSEAPIAKKTYGRGSRQFLKFRSR